MRQHVEGEQKAVPAQGRGVCGRVGKGAFEKGREPHHSAASNAPLCPSGREPTQGAGQDIR